MTSCIWCGKEVNKDNPFAWKRNQTVKPILHDNCFEKIWRVAVTMNNIEKAKKELLGILVCEETTQK